MAQRETERLNQILAGAALSRAVSCIAEYGIADLIEQGKPQPAAVLAKASGLHEQALYRVMRYLASHHIFAENEAGEFDHTPLSYVLRSDVEGSYRGGRRCTSICTPAGRAWTTRCAPASRGSTRSSANRFSNTSWRTPRWGRFSTRG